MPVRLESIEFVLIDRATMARVHADFLGDPSATDVITFPYGEILICPAVAAEQAERSGLALEEEVLLYGLHGLLHLAGYDDVSPKDARQMARAQNRLLEQVLSLSRRSMTAEDKKKRVALAPGGHRPPLQKRKNDQP